MYSLKCPLCGKQTPQSSFRPEDFEEDIFVVEVVGLGRGRGFANRGMTSAFDDQECEELLDRVARRSLTILGLLVDRGLLSEGEVLDKIGIQDSLENMTEGIANALEEDSEDREIENEEGRERTEVDVLQFAVRRLIDEFDSLRASGDDKKL